MCSLAECSSEKLRYADAAAIDPDKAAIRIEVLILWPLSNNQTAHCPAQKLSRPGDFDASLDS
jgi:hypothetical protein